MIRAAPKGPTAMPSCRAGPAGRPTAPPPPPPRMRRTNQPERIQPAVAADHHLASRVSRYSAPDEATAALTRVGPLRIGPALRAPGQPVPPAVGARRWAPQPLATATTTSTVPPPPTRVEGRERGAQAVDRPWVVRINVVGAGCERGEVDDHAAPEASRGDGSGDSPTAQGVGHRRHRGVVSGRFGRRSSAVDVGDCLQV